MLFAKLPPDVAHAVPADQLVRQQDLCSEALRSIVERKSIMDKSTHQYSAAFPPPAERVEVLMLPQEWQLILWVPRRRRQPKKGWVGRAIATTHNKRG